MKKTLIIFVVFVISWTVNALGIEAITENGKRVLLKDDGTWKYIETKNPGAFDVIVGEWISVEDSSGEYFLVNFDGQVCFKERIYEDPCYDFSFIELGDNQFGMKGDDRYLFEFDEDLIVGFKKGEKFATYKRYYEEEKLELNDKEKAVLQKMFTVIPIDAVDPFCVEKNYLSLSANQKKEFVYIFYDFPWSSSGDVQEEYLNSIVNQGIDFDFYGEYVIDSCER